MRIMAALETSPCEKIVWFLVPTQTLCSQQFDFLTSQIPAVGAAQFKAYDNWSDQKLWDGMLHDVRIVVSTYQVLLDALCHAFVKLASLALIVFDEGQSSIPRPGSPRVFCAPADILPRLPLSHPEGSFCCA